MTNTFGGQLAKVSDLIVVDRYSQQLADAIKQGNDGLLMSALMALKNVRLRSEELWSEQVREFAISELEFTTRDVYTALNAATTQQKAAVRKSIQRMVEEKALEQKGRGLYRVIQGELVEVEILDPNTIKEYPIDWPLSISKWFVTYPRTVAIIAGTKDGGKTLMLLDIIKRNMDKHRVHYFFSEMGVEEFSMRLSKHEDISLDEWNFHAYERSDNFEDVIFPDDLNIIDYIEENESPMVMGEKIKRIHEKLRKGIAIIGIQKDYGATLGRGRAYTLQRPRLYLTLEHKPTQGFGVVRCISAKNRRDPENGLAGKEIDYKIIGGWKLQKAVDDWSHSTEDYFGKAYSKT